MISGFYLIRGGNFCNTAEIPLESLKLKNTNSYSLGYLSKDDPYLTQ